MISEGKILMENTALKVVKTFHTAHYSEGISHAAPLLSDDLTVCGFMPHPVTRKAFVFGLKLLLTAMPDARSTIETAHARGDVITLTYQVSGSDTKPLDLSAIRLPVVLPSNKVVAWPNAQWGYAVVDGKITEIRMVETSDSGMPGILKVFGITMPKIISK